MAYHTNWTPEQVALFDKIMKDKGTINNRERLNKIVPFLIEEMKASYSEMVAYIDSGNKNLELYLSSKGIYKDNKRNIQRAEQRLIDIEKDKENIIKNMKDGQEYVIKKSADKVDKAEANMKITKRRFLAKYRKVNYLSDNVSFNDHTEQ